VVVEVAQGVAAPLQLEQVWRDARARGHVRLWLGRRAQVWRWAHTQDTCMSVCLYVSLCIYIHVCVRASVSVCMCVYVCVCVSVCVFCMVAWGAVGVGLGCYACVPLYHAGNPGRR
jgi:hypothetical protein